ncbi:MAG: hypothetical protein ACXAE3_10515 [Candidatus Kariarchaeaceae archaeon]|jgi:hypothetical protein
MRALVILLIVIGLIPGGGIESNVIAIQSEQQQNPDMVVNTSLWGQGIDTGNRWLESNQSIAFSGIRKSTNLSLDTQVWSDTLMYDTDFSFWNNGTGSLESTRPTESNSTIVSIGNGIYSNDYTVHGNSELQPESVLFISVADLIFSLEDVDFGYVNIILEFDTLRLIINLAGSSLYQSILKNETGIVTLIHNTDVVIVNTEFLAEVAEVQVPTSLQSILILSYLNRNYSFRIEFDRISIYHEVETLMVDSRDIAADEIEWQIDPNETIHVIVPHNHRLWIAWTRSYQIEERVLVNVVKSDAGLNGSYTILSEVDPGFIEYYHHGLIMSEDNVTGASGSNYTHFWIDFEGKITVTGILIPLHSWEDHSPLMQNQWWNIDIPVDLWNNSYAFHHGDTTVDKGSNTESSVRYLIPQSWSEGEISMFVFHDNGSYIQINGNLNYSPSQIISQKVWNFTPTQGIIIPVILQNMTSGEEFKPERIMTYLNDSLRSIDNSEGIIINPGEFPVGETVLLINATHSEFASVQYEIILYVQSVNFNPELQVRRLAADTVELDINTEEFANWSIRADLRINWESGQEEYRLQGTLSTLTLSDNEWKSGEEIQLFLLIVLDLDLGEYSFEVTVGVFDSSSEDRQNTGWVTTVSTMGISSIIVSASYKVYQLKYGEKTLSF